MIKVFNKRCYDAGLGFYKANDFTKVLEYFIDKYLIKTLGKCKEEEFLILPDVMEAVSQYVKTRLPQQVGADGSISISLAGTDLAPRVLNQAPVPREFLLKHSS